MRYYPGGHDYTRIESFTQMLFKPEKRLVQCPICLRKIPSLGIRKILCRDCKEECKELEKK